jgi:pSer/pThr/pTyr-binding forkhead associated (FHA) protein
MFTLIIEDKDGAIASEHSFEEGEFIIGRSHSSDIVLPADNVSRRHARLYTQNGKVFVEDMNSSNGVYVDGQRIHRVHEIAKSAQIKVGDFYIHVESAGIKTDAGPEAFESGRPGVPAQAVAAPSSSSRSGIFGRLVGASGEMEGRSFDVVNEVMMVGRGKDCSMTIIDTSVSRVHAKILVATDGSLSVEDAGSSNGTYVNDERIKKAGFSHGDYVRFGNMEFICEMPGYGDAPLVQVASSGRKGLISTIAFLVVLLVGGVTSLYVFKDQIFGPSQAQLERRQAEKDKQEKSAKEQKRRLDTARYNIEQLLDDARLLAQKDEWGKAQQKLREAANALGKISDLDKGGEVRELLDKSERELRNSRSDYLALKSAFDKKDYEGAREAYAKFKDGKGSLAAMATKLFVEAKAELVASAAALCEAKEFKACLAYYTQAFLLDPTDKEVATMKARTRINMNKNNKKRRRR